MSFIFSNVKLQFLKLTGIEYSVVIPVFNSSKSISLLTKELTDVFENKRNFEIIFVNDYSTDKSLEILFELQKQYFNVRIVNMHKNCGLIPATLTGIYCSAGQYVITIDDDGQYSPDAIKTLISKKDSSLMPIIYGYASKRSHKAYYNVLAKLVMFIYNQILLRSCNHINYFTSFRLIDRKVFLDANQRFIPHHLMHIWRFNPKQMAHVSVEHNKRKVGKSNLNFKKLWRHFKPLFWYGIYKAGIYFLILTVALLVVLLSFRLSNFLMIAFLSGIISIILVLLGSIRLKEQITNLESEVFNFGNKFYNNHTFQKL